MPLVSHPVPGQTIASAWGSLVADQVIMTFATAAARASALPAPLVGQVTARNDNPGGLEIWNGTAWIAVAAPPTNWTTYTPTWAAGGSSAGLAVGSGGTLTARYRMIAPYTLAVAAYINPGSSGFNGGSGQWTFSLPAGYTFVGGGIVASHAMIVGGNPNVGNCYITGSSLLAPASTGPGGTFNWWSATFPYNPWTAAMTGQFGAVMNVAQRW